MYWATLSTSIYLEDGLLSWMQVVIGSPLFHKFRPWMAGVPQPDPSLGSHDGPMTMGQLTNHVKPRRRIESHGHPVDAFICDRQLFLRSNRPKKSPLHRRDKNRRERPVGFQYQWNLKLSIINSWSINVVSMHRCQKGDVNFVCMCVNISMLNFMCSLLIHTILIDIHVMYTSNT